MTVIARAPLRIGLAGGGTDLPAYAEQFTGLVVSTTIDRYVYVILTDTPEDTLQITAADANSTFSRRDHLFDSALFWGADYRLPMEILDYFGISGGKHVFIASEVPPGTGLGSSSSTAVALIQALSLDRSLGLGKRELAEIACHVEIDRMNMPIGRQDQFAASYGGLNTITFLRDSTTIQPLNTDLSVARSLDERLLLFFTGKRRRSTDILTHQRDATAREGSATLLSLHQIKALAVEMQAAIERGDLDTVGRILDESWQLKRRLAPGVSNTEIDEWYEAAKEAGAIGGKITGAGGGGFLLTYTEPARQRDVIQCLSEHGLVWVDTSFDRDGASAVLPPTPSLIPAD